MYNMISFVWYFKTRTKHYMNEYKITIYRTEL